MIRRDDLLDHLSDHLLDRLLALILRSSFVRSLALVSGSRSSPRVADGLRDVPVLGARPRGRFVSYSRHAVGTLGTLGTPTHQERARAAEMKVSLDAAAMHVAPVDVRPR
jgi:hypothetical protein